MKREKIKKENFSPLLSEHLFIHKAQNIENQKDKYSNAIENGLKFYYYWIEENLPLEKQALIKQEIVQFSQPYDIPSIHAEMRMPKSILDNFYHAGKEALTQHPQTGLIDLFKFLTYLLPNSYDIWMGLGLSHQKMHQNHEALQAFEQAKHIHPHLFHPYLFQAESHLHLKNFPLCENGCIQAQQLMEGTPDPFFSYANHLISQCHKKRAL